MAIAISFQNLDAYLRSSHPLVAHRRIAQRPGSFLHHHLPHWHGRFSRPRYQILSGLARRVLPFSGRNGRRRMKNARLLSLLSFAFGSALTLFIGTFGPPEPVSIRAREHTEGFSQWVSASRNNHHVGTLEAVEISLANPDGTFPDREARLRKPEWVFENASEPELARFLDNCPLEHDERGLILDRHHWQISSNGCIIRPSDQLIWGLNPLARQRVYALLAASPRNYSQQFPFRFPLNTFENRLKESGLAPSRVEKLKTLTYTNAGVVCFADLYSARDYLDPAEFNRFVETLCAVPAYLLRLRLDPECNLDEIIHYWGRGGREKLIAPLLTSIARVP